MGIKFSNNGHSTLAASITSSGTSITVASGHGSRFPSLAAGDYFYATLIDASNNLEIVKCTARSSDVLTVTRGAESTTARAYAIGDRIELRVTAAGLDEAAQIYDKDSSSTGSFGLPVGTTAQEPTAASSTGHIRFDTDEGVVMFSDGTDWYKIAAQVAQLTSVSGDIFAGAASTLTLTGSGFLTSNLVVNFTQSSDSIDEDITVTPTSDTSATVTTTSAIYSNVTAGNSVTIQVTNSDGMSSGTQSTTAKALPSGGTITTSGSYRIHRFTSSGTFTNTIASLSVDYLLAAGAGPGGAGNPNEGGGGGGAGGLLNGSTTLSATNYSITIGGGGGATNNTSVNGSNGSNSTALGLTAIGGGAGGACSAAGGSSGGSGGGGSGCGQDRPGGSGTSGQGNSGGTGAWTGGGGQGTNGNGGGGGGKNSAGQYGQSRTGSTVGGQGSGLSSSITGSSITYSEGGGGGPGKTSNYTGNAGAANTGEGGEGSANSNYSGAGGSGVFIVRYQL